MEGIMNNLNDLKVGDLVAVSKKDIGRPKYWIHFPITEITDVYIIVDGTRYDITNGREIGYHHWTKIVSYITLATEHLDERN